MTEDEEERDFERVGNSNSAVVAEALLFALDMKSVGGEVCMLNDLLVKRDAVFMSGICVSQLESVQVRRQMHEYPPCVLVQLPLF